MLEYLQQALKLDSETWWLLVAMTLASVYVSHLILNDWMITVISAPLIYTSAALARAVLQDAGIQMSSDKAVYAGFAFGVGIVMFGVVLATCFWVNRYVLKT